MTNQNTDDLPEERARTEPFGPVFARDEDARYFYFHAAGHDSGDRGPILATAGIRLAPSGVALMAFAFLGMSDDAPRVDVASRAAGRDSVNRRLFHLGHHAQKLTKLPPPPYWQEHESLAGALRGVIFEDPKAAIVVVNVLRYAERHEWADRLWEQPAKGALASRPARWLPEFRAVFAGLVRGAAIASEGAEITISPEADDTLARTVFHYVVNRRAAGFPITREGLSEPASPLHVEKIILHARA